MRYRSLLVAAIVSAGVSAISKPASASTPTTCTYSFTLGLGGSISGCYSGVLSQLGEDAGLVSTQYFWAGNFTGSSGSTNSPATAGTLMFNDDCGSSGGGIFAFCTGPFAKTPASVISTGGELVLGLNVPDNTYGTGFYWEYSGTAARNGTPPPAGFQQVLLQLTLGGVDQPGQFLFAWEDLNSGCTVRPPTSPFTNNRFREEDLGNGALLDNNNGKTTCTAITPGGNSDSDFNDSYIQFDISGVGNPTNVTPEPMTMSLMALGLVAMGGTSLRRRKKKSL
ncbi:MAG: PEP-CTERM sorting domain-containing protein [Gemmatimonadales bacterium]